ncbi:unnamed protein product, partial [Symbiodinium microadriaticum]
ASPHAQTAANAIVTQFENGTFTWAQCFRSLSVQEANLTAVEDVYDSRGYSIRKAWVTGPNKVFRSVLRAAVDKSFGEYSHFFYMELDSVPIRADWLQQYVAEALYYPTAAMRGSRYRGDTWDGFLKDLPTELLVHINGNAIYNVEHPWTVQLLTYLEDPSFEVDSVAFDIKIANLSFEEFGSALADRKVMGGSRAAPGPFAVHHSRLTSSELTARYNTLESGFPPLPSSFSKFMALAWADAGRTSPSPEALAIPVMKRQVWSSPWIWSARSFVVDFGPSVLDLLRDLGEDIVADGIFPYSLHQPEATPLGDELLAAARAWVAELGSERVAFYSALEEAQEPVPVQEGKAKSKKANPKRRVTTADLAMQLGQLASVLPQLSEQLSTMRQRQEDMEKQMAAGAQVVNVANPKPAHQQHFLPPKGPGLPVAKNAPRRGAASLGHSPSGCGPGCFGCRSGPPADPFQAAVLQQSSALTSLVQHLVSQQDGGLTDLSASGSSSYVGSKGAARREKLQAALAARSGDFYLSVLQAAAKRLRPSSPSPASLEECSGQVSMCQYLERFGGYAGQREIGYTLWCLAHVMDCLTEQDVAGAQEFLALTFVALDQASLVHGRWDLAWLLTLLEEPPAQLFHGRGQSVNPRTRASSPLSPVGWTTCALQYLKEVDLITARFCAAGLRLDLAVALAPLVSALKLAKPAPLSGVVFPLPLRIMHQRLLHIVCMALNFLHSNFVPIPFAALQRPLNAAQRSLVAHRSRHLKAFGASVGEFPLSDSGRRNPQLIARLSELMSFLSAASAATGDTYADRSGTVVPMQNDAFPGLDPFKSLDVSRLKLAGRGLWDPLPHLPAELYMAFAEPSCLAHGALPPDDFVPVWTHEDPRETARLATFGMSWGFCALLLPALSSPLCFAPFGSSSMASARPAFGGRGSLLFNPGDYLVCFGAVAQGDHLGVEIGSAAHSSILEAGGLLDPSCRISSNRPFKGASCAQGLVIDDFFSISIHDDCDPSPPACLDHLATAKAIYLREGLIGSDDKDIVGLPLAKIAGAEVNSTPFVRALGLCTIASPASKRAALAAISLEASRFTQITDSLMLSLLGSWTSALLFRRPLMSVFSAVYEVCHAATVRPSRPVLRSLPRPAAQELVLISVLSPLACCNVAASFNGRLYATDASEDKGGYVVAEASADLLRPLWRTASKKGGYSRLLSKEEAVLARFSDPETYDLRVLCAPPTALSTRPLAFYFDFLEVGCTAGQVTSLVASFGRTVGPVFSLRESPAFDLRDLRAVEWILHLLEHRRIKCIMLVPPTLYSVPGAAGKAFRPRYVVVFLPCLGLESCVINDVVLSLRWVPGADWCWRATAHINILEAASILRLLRALAPFAPLRAVILVDSSVAFHSCAKGRSPSRGLQPVLRKICAVCVASGIYPAFHFVPTRLNPGDCPTRDLPLPKPCRSSFWASLCTDELYKALAQPKLRRWASNWVRLVVLASGSPPAYRPALGWRSLHSSQSSSRARSELVLGEGRPVEQVTQKRRDKLLQAFSDWLLQQDEALGWPYSHYSEVINAVSSREPALRRIAEAFAALRTMEIYIQEISSLQFIHLLEPSSRQRVFSLVDSFHAVLLVAEQLQDSPYKADSLLIGNYAQMLLNSSCTALTYGFDSAEYIRHGATGNIFENIDDSQVMALDSEFSAFLDSLRYSHPFRKVIIMGAQIFNETSYSISTPGGILFRFLVWAWALLELNQSSPSDDDGGVLIFSSGQELSEAEAFYGVELLHHHDTFDLGIKYLAVKHPNQEASHKPPFELLGSGLAAVEDWGSELRLWTLPAQLLIVLVSIGGTGEHKQLLLTEANAWTLPANSIPGPRQVPKSKTSVGSRTWGVLSKAHPVDLRECSVCVSLESDAYFEMSTWRPIFGSGKCIDTPENVEVTSTGTTTTQTFTVLPGQLPIAESSVDVMDCLGAMVVEGKTVGETCEVVCSEGFEGPVATLTCGEGETFTGDLPTCSTTTMTSTATSTVTELVYCSGGLPSGRGVVVSDCSGLANGQTCDVTCDTGFQGPLSALPVAATDVDASSCENTEAGSFCFMRCPAGYVFAESVLTCQADLSFSGTPPTCERIACGTSGLPQDVSYNISSCIGTLSNETCEVTCKRGYDGS